METEEKQADLKASESQEDVLNKKVGNIETVKLQPGKVVAKDVTIEIQRKKDSEVIAGKIVHVRCKHPDREELIDITKVLYRKDAKEKVKESGLWYNEDKEGNIQKGSAVAVLMNFVGKTTLRALENTELETETNDAGYLCFKAYK